MTRKIAVVLMILGIALGNEQVSPKMVEIAKAYVEHFNNNNKENE